MTSAAGLRKEVAALHFEIEIVCASKEPDQNLVIYTCQPDSATAGMLSLPASWDAPVAPPAAASGRSPA